MKNEKKHEPSNVAQHAFDFLLPINPQSSILTIAKRLLLLMNNDEDVLKKFLIIQKKIEADSKPMIDEKQSELFEAMKSQIVVPDIPTSPEWARPLIAVAYLRAKVNISGGKAVNLFKNLSSNLDKVSKMLDSLESGFLGELLIQTIKNARADSDFNNTIQKAGEEFKSIVKDAYIFKDAIEPIGNPTESQAIARVGGGLGAGGCTVCRRVGGRTECSPISCWIIVIIIIIVIVGK